MNPKSPLVEPLKVVFVDGEVVFLGHGAVNFSMTPDAAARTARALAEVLGVSAAYAETPGVAVLVVEDEAMLRAHVAGVLSDAGYHVIEAGDAEEALGELERGVPVRLVFADIQTPGELDGLALARLVSVRWPHTPLLLCSGRIDLDSGVLPTGGRFLSKPYDLGVMLRHVHELTGREETLPAS